MLIVDISTLDKPYAQKIGLVHPREISSGHKQGSGKHHKVVRRINPVTVRGVKARAPFAAITVSMTNLRVRRFFEFHNVIEAG